jgi:predicted O-linked N-acetylglucosamine transferase (SPINDLY family)
MRPLLRAASKPLTAISGGDGVRKNRKSFSARSCFMPPESFQQLFEAAHRHLQAGRNDEALLAMRRAVALSPNFAAGHNNLGCILYAKNDFGGAAESFSRALTLEPDSVLTRKNLGDALKAMGEIEQAVECYRRSLAAQPDFVPTHSDLILALQYCPGAEPEIGEECRRFNDRHIRPLRSSIHPHENDRDPDRRLRIGYVSADFFEHVSRFFLDSLLRSHDHSNFEIYCYAQFPIADFQTLKFQQYADHWRDVRRMSDEQLAEQIRADQIDILVDLKLHTVGNRLLTFARKPAPVQISWLGYPGTSGVETIEYRLTDPYLEPDQNSGAIRLPDCFWCYDPLGDDPAVNKLPALAGGGFTFGCLNHTWKMNDSVLLLWAKVLLAVEKSRLLTLSAPGSARERILDRFSRNAIDPSRIEFVDRLKRPEYLEQYHRIDLGLDTFPYNGHTTNLDSLWMGVPMITMIGKTPVGRAGFSQLSNLNLQDFAAQTPGKYIEIAANFARNLPRLAAIRQTLRPRMQQSPLMDAARFTRNIESAYRDIWKSWCNKPTP